MLKRIFIGSALLLLATGACKEVYFPNLDENNSGLVVEALITDEPGPYTIKLSQPIPFKGGSVIPVPLAKVHLEDSENNTYNFEETIPGSYVSDPSKFIPKYGVSYTLIIQTRDGKAYRSSAQTLYPKGSLDTISYIIKNATLTTYYGEGGKLSQVKGAEFVGTINLLHDNSPYYRFSNTLMLEYVSQDLIFGKDTQDLPKYCWVKYIPYQYLNLSDRRSNTVKTQQLLGFCPLDTFYYGVILTPIYSGFGGAIHLAGWTYKTPEVFLLTFKEYHLNQDIYKYYRSVNDQLAANQQVLDPVSVQSIGNIICTTNPDEPVLGIFEVSSINRYTVLYTGEHAGSLADYKKIGPLDLTHIPESDCQKDSAPNFWVYR